MVMRIVCAVQRETIWTRIPKYCMLVACEASAAHVKRFRWLCNGDLQLRANKYIAREDLQKDREYCVLILYFVDCAIRKECRLVNQAWTFLLRVGSAVDDETVNVDLEFLACEDGVDNCCMLRWIFLEAFDHEDSGWKLLTLLKCHFFNPAPAIAYCFHHCTCKLTHFLGLLNPFFIWSAEYVVSLVKDYLLESVDQDLQNISHGHFLDVSQHILLKWKEQVCTWWECCIYTKLIRRGLKLVAVKKETHILDEFDNVERVKSLKAEVNHHVQQVIHY